MAEPYYKDVVEDGLNRLLHQWKDKPYAVGFLQSLLENVQVVEDLYQQLLNERSIYTAIGVQLDVLGLILGIDRNGRDDEAYRAALLARISFNTGNSTPESMLEVLRLLTNSDVVDIWEHFPASAHLYAETGVTNDVALTSYYTSAAGVNTRVMTDQGGGSFIPSEISYAEFDLVTEALDNIEVDTGDLLQTINVVDEGSGDNSWLPELDDPEETNFLCDVLPNKIYRFQIGNIITQDGDIVAMDNGDTLEYQILEEAGDVTTFDLS